MRKRVQMREAFRSGLCVFAALFLLGCTEAADGAAPLPGETVIDCEGCPEMVLAPAGSFVMGSPQGERYRGSEDQHTVTIAEPFLAGKYEVTFDQWDVCLAEGGCGGYPAADHGWGRGNRPVIEMSWDDAQSFIAWLSAKTGKQYRLLSEAEWEYAARAGGTGPFATGDTITSAQANYDGTTAYGGGAAGEFRGRTLPVGSFPPNAFGLYDVHGNVWEWVEDCWNDEYTADAPADGSPWLEGDCSGRVLKGGSWEDYAGDVRAAARVASTQSDGTWSDGFRVARDF